ncbi:hypothetical protein BVRB_007610 [Beta vulgaris subsp. vulgaris]|uniref:Uncharacterized protein n=1 Tax=Beta vulgaris subsp. vulgaris TaxID=3555 RepID=A0A0J8DXD4_BETVV|nr:hypothetical protein BVRB_007610 [Beta vulgaris subsp. vulgaris]
MVMNIIFQFHHGIRKKKPVANFWLYFMATEDGRLIDEDTCLSSSTS